MKISELFVELGFDIKNVDRLKEVEKSLTNAATAAAALVTQLKQLAVIKISARLRSPSVNPPTPPSSTPPGGSVPPQVPIVPAGPPGMPYGPPMPPPVLPSVLPQTALPQQPQGMGTQVMTFMRNMWRGLGFLGLALSIKQLISTIKEMGLAAMKAQVEMKQMTQQTSMTRDEIKQWEYVGKLAGMSAEETHNQLLAITDMANAMKYLMHPGPQPSLGIPMQAMQPGQVLQEFARRMEGRPASEQRMFAQAYNIDPRLILSLRNNPQAFEEARRRLDANQSQLTAVENLNTAFVQLRSTIEEQVMVSLGKMAPALTLIANTLEWLAKNIEVRFGMFSSFATVGKFVTSSLKTAGPMAAEGMLKAGIESYIGYRNSANRPNVTVNNTNQTTVSGVEKPREVANAVADAIENANQRMFSDNYWQSPVYSGFGTNAVFDIPQ